MNTNLDLSSCQKRQISLRYWLQAREYYDALGMLNLVEGLYESKFRKDGVTPEIDHPISIALFARLLPSLMHPQETITAALGHDLGEPPYNLARAEYEKVGGALSGEAIFRMTKKHREVVYDEAMIFDGIARDPIASVVKPIDRNHNYLTMSGVFGLEKKKSYIDDGYRLFLPALKISRRLFPRQEPAYEIVQHVMKSQISLIEFALRAEEKHAA